MSKNEDEKKRRKWGRVEKLPSGNFRVKYLDPDGKLVSKKGTFLTEEEADDWLRETKTNIVNFARVGEVWTPERESEVKLTVRELIEKWLKESTEIKKESTRQSHMRRMRSRVLNTPLADKRVVKVTNKDILSWHKMMVSEHPDQPVTNAGAYRTLSTAFSHARDSLELISENPVKVKGASKAPKTKNLDVEVLTPEEVAAIADNITPRYKIAILLMAYAGLRIGEVIPLQVGDFSMKQDTMIVKVRRGAARVKDEATNKMVLEVGLPKTTAGVRDIALPSKIAEEVKNHIQQFVDDPKNPESLLITTSTGNMVMDTSLRSRMIPAAEAAGRPEVRPHDLRRYYATSLLNHGQISLTECCRLMGHTKVDQLLEYQRASKNYEIIAAANLDKLI